MYIVNIDVNIEHLMKIELFLNNRMIPDFRIQHLNIVIVLKKQHEIRF